MQTKGTAASTSFDLGMRCLRAFLLLTFPAIYLGHQNLWGATDGKLTVTATVVTSVALISDESGQQKIVIANAPAADNVSYLTPVLSVDNTLPAKTGKQSPIKKLRIASVKTLR